MDIKRKLDTSLLYSSNFFTNSKYYYEYFTVEMLEDYEEGDLRIDHFYWRDQVFHANITYEYSKNGGEWMPVLPAAQPETVTEDTPFWETMNYTVPAGLNGDTIRFRMNLASFVSDSNSLDPGNWDHYQYMYGLKNHNIYGNIMSLIYGDSFMGQNSLELQNEDAGIHVVCNFTEFCRENNVISAENLILPAIKLQSESYQGFFEESKLQKAPKLLDCQHQDIPYQEMFRDCKDLEGDIYVPLSYTSTDTTYNVLFNDNYQKKESTDPRPKYRATIDLSNNSTNFNKIFNSFLYLLQVGMTSYPGESTEAIESRITNHLSAYKFILPDEFDLNFSSLYTVDDQRWITKISRRYNLFDYSELYDTYSSDYITIDDVEYPKKPKHPTCDNDLGEVTGETTGDTFGRVECKTKLTPNKPENDFQYIAQVEYKNGEFYGEYVVDETIFIKCICEQINADYQKYGDIIKGNLNSKYQKLLKTPLTFKASNLCEFKWDLLGYEYDVKFDFKDKLLFSFDKVNWLPYQGPVTVPSGAEISWKMKEDIREMSFVDNYGDEMSLKGAKPSFSLSVRSNIDPILEDGVRFPDNSEIAYDSMQYEGYFDVSGNIMSLLSNNFETLVEIPWDYCFRNTFQYTNIQSSRDLLLPATILTNGCYEEMFAGCRHMISAPYILPAKNPWIVNHHDKLYYNIPIYRYEVDLRYSNSQPVYDYSWEEMMLPCVYTTFSDPIVDNIYNDDGSIRTFYAPDAHEYSGEVYRYTKYIEVYYKDSQGNYIRIQGPGTDNEWVCIEPAETITYQDLYLKTVEGDYINVLQFKRLTECYREMFSGCTDLTNPPKINLTSIGIHYYDSEYEQLEVTNHCSSMMSGMFEDSGLIVGPDCNVCVSDGKQTFDNGNYTSMYSGCSKLEQVTFFTIGAYNTGYYMGNLGGEFQYCFTGCNDPVLYGFESMHYDILSYQHGYFTFEPLNDISEDEEISSVTPGINIDIKSGTNSCNLELTGWNEYEGETVTYKGKAYKKSLTGNGGYTWRYFIETYNPHFSAVPASGLAQQDFYFNFNKQSGNLNYIYVKDLDQSGKWSFLYYNNARVLDTDYVVCIPGQESTTNDQLDYELRLLN